MTALPKGEISYYLKCLFVFTITFGFGYLPPFASLTPLGMKAIGIFLGVLFGWAFLDMLWPSLLGIFAVGLSGFMTMPKSFACAFGDNITLQMLFILIFVAYLELCGCSNYIARWFVTRKCAIGRPWVLSLLIMTVGFVLSMFTIGTSAIILTWAIFYEVCGLFGMNREDSWTRQMLWGIVFAAMIGAICLPYQVMSVNIHRSDGAERQYHNKYISLFSLQNHNRLSSCHNLLAGMQIYLQARCLQNYQCWRRVG